MASTFETENPSFAAAAAEPQDHTVTVDSTTKFKLYRADLEAAVATLGVKSELDTVEAMERLLRARDAALRAEVRAEFAARLEGTNTVRSIVARLGEAPPNWHQATVMFAASDGDDARWRVGSLVLSVLMVMGQSMVTVGMWLGTAAPACGSNDQCGQTGTYCQVRPQAMSSALSATGRCQYCGVDVPLPQEVDPATGGTLNWVMAPDFAGFNNTLIVEACAAPIDRRGTAAMGNVVIFPRAAVVSWCEACVHPIDGQVDELSEARLAAANVKAMGLFDWVALVLATVVVALTIGGELKDIELCDLANRHASDRIAPAWRSTLSLLSGIRRWLFLPSLVGVTPSLVMFKGGDALNVCFNTVAVLFLCEIDNLAYAVFLPERLHARVETDGRVELGEAEALSLARSKAVHMMVLVAMVPCGVALAGVGDSSGSSMGVGLFLPLVALWLAGVAKAVLGAASASEACKEVGKVTGSWLLGLVGNLLLGMISLLWT